MVYCLECKKCFYRDADIKECVNMGRITQESVNRIKGDKNQIEDSIVNLYECIEGLNNKLELVGRLVIDLYGRVNK